MQNSKTTIAGTIAGLGMSLQALPDLPPWARVVSLLVVACALVALGWHAAECPANCPGTDSTGRPRIHSPESRGHSPESRVPSPKSKGSDVEAQDSRLRTQDSGLQTQDSGPAPPVVGLLVLGALALAVVLACCTGCTLMYARSHASQGQGTNRVDKSGLLYGITFFDSGQVLGKTRVAMESTTNGMWAGGISTAGLTQQATSSNVVTIIQNFPKMVPVP
jgi:hypothetical protein